MLKTSYFTKNQLLSVDIGTEIEIEVNGNPQNWKIVDFGQSDIPNGKISRYAPLIQPILGAKEGDRIICRVMDKNIEIVIKKVSFLSQIA